VQDQAPQPRSGALARHLSTAPYNLIHLLKPLGRAMTLRRAGSAACALPAKAPANLAFDGSEDDIAQFFGLPMHRRIQRIQPSGDLSGRLVQSKGLGIIVRSAYRPTMSSSLGRVGLIGDGWFCRVHHSLRESFAPVSTRRRMLGPLNVHCALTQFRVASATAAASSPSHRPRS
jgi:hypothetical protein